MNLPLNTIINEDSLEFMRKLPDKCIDVAFTSPPYNRKRNDKYENYDDTLDDYYGLLIQSIDEMRRITKGNVFVNIQKNYYNKVDVFNLLGHYSKEICEIFIWEKSNPMPACGFNITNAYEFVIVFGESIKSNKTYTKNHITTSVAKMLKSHKAIMHTDIADFFIKNFTQEGDIVLDPFAGAGTTALVSKKHGRNYIGVEISKEYCEIAQKRLDNSTMNLF